MLVKIVVEDFVSVPLRFWNIDVILVPLKIGKWVASKGYSC